MIEKELLYAAIGTGATFLATALGAAMVFLFRKDIKPVLQKMFLGFAAGVMIAASIWSLLIPAMDMAREMSMPVWLPTGVGFTIGGLFLLLLDRLMPHIHIGNDKTEGLQASKLKRNTLVVFAVTLHNIPEGMAVGLAFSVAAQDMSGGALAGAIALAIGMGIQNFPEGAAISLPLKASGTSSGKAFLYGSMSGVVEPIFGLLAVLLAASIKGLMPWILSFAAGAMIYVVVEELIPEARLGEHSNAGTISVMVGFLVMMLLDVMLS